MNNTENIILHYSAFSRITVLLYLQGRGSKPGKGTPGEVTVVWRDVMLRMRTRIKEENVSCAAENMGNTLL
jgi:hypothetical protein